MIVEVDERQQEAGMLMLELSSSVSRQPQTEAHVLTSFKQLVQWVTVVSHQYQVVEVTERKVAEAAEDAEAAVADFTGEEFLFVCNFRRIVSEKCARRLGR